MNHDGYRVQLQCESGSCRGAMARDVATPATAATTHAEQGLERGDNSGDSRHFLHALAVMLDHLFVWV